MYTKHNGDNPKLMIFSFIPQQGSIQPNFYESYIPNNKPNKHSPNNQNNDINVGFTTNTKFVLLQLRQRKFWSIHIHTSTNFKKFIFNQFRTFHSSPICTFHQSRQPCRWLDEQFHTFHPTLHESVTSGYGPVKSFWSSIKEDFSGIPETTDDENLKKTVVSSFSEIDVSVESCKIEASY